MTRIALVHANTDDRTMYAEYLRAYGCEVLEAATTDAAVPLLAGCDVLVTGLLVPGDFDGVELIRRVRADSIVGRKPVVVVTACALESVQEQARQAGCDALLLKPCLPDVLLAEIHAVMAKRL